MQGIAKNIVFVLLGLFLSIIAERAIPHAHIEHEGHVIPDWEHQDDAPHHEEDSEGLHNSLYQPCTVDYSFEATSVDLAYLPDLNIQEPLSSITISDFNILPKVFSHILFVVHTYSSKAPPFH